MAVLAWPRVSGFRARPAPEVAGPRAMLAGLGFVCARAWVIAAAITRLKLRALRGERRLLSRDGRPA